MTSRRTVIGVVVVAAVSLALAPLNVHAVRELAVAALNSIGSSQDDQHVSADRRTAVPADLDLAGVTVVPSRPARTGYDRDCGPDAACSFGPAWTDDHAGPGGHNGCGTRDDVLARDLTHIRTRPGTNGCVVTAGRLTDPYSGRTMEFTKSEAGRVQIDHVYPLALAWDMGADRWTQQHRIDFANAQGNLLAVDGPTNASKGDRSPGEWLPLSAPGRCTYLARYVDVARTWKLPITRDDATAISRAYRSCPGGH